MGYEHVTLLEVLSEMGLLDSIEAKVLRYSIEGECPEEHEDLFVEARLLNSEVVTEHQLNVAKRLQKGLNDEDLVVRSETRGTITKMRAAQLRKRIVSNQQLADAAIRSGSELEKKSSSSEYLAVGLISDEKSG